MSYATHMVQMHAEEEASSLSPPRGVQGLRRELQPGALRKHPEEFRVKKITR